MKSQYELERDERVARNKQIVAALGLKNLHDALVDSIRPLRRPPSSRKPKCVVPSSPLDRTHLKRASTAVAKSYCELSPKKQSTKPRNSTAFAPLTKERLSEYSQIHQMSASKIKARKAWLTDFDSNSNKKAIGIAAQKLALGLSALYSAPSKMQREVPSSAEAKPLVKEILELDEAGWMMWAPYFRQLLDESELQEEST